jgi:hypothetical protein
MDNIVHLHRDDDGQVSFSYHFDFGKIISAVEFLRAFGEGGTFGTEAEGVNELLSFVDFILSKSGEAIP